MKLITTAKVIIILFATAFVIADSLLSMDDPLTGLQRLHRPRSIDMNRKLRVRSILNDPTGTSISTRSPGTVGAHLGKRFIWAWSLSQLLWAGVTAVSGLFAAGCQIYSNSKPLTTGGKVACGVAVAVAAVGALGTFAATYAAGQAAAGAMEWEMVTGITSAISKRDGKEVTNSTNPLVNALVAAHLRHRFHHQSDDSLVTYTHILNANKTHPIKVYGAGTQMPTPQLNYTLWTEIHPQTNRTMFMAKFPHTTGDPALPCREVECLEIEEGLNLCESDNDLPASDPTDWYTGVDIYGFQQQLLEWDEDTGDYFDNGYNYAETNGFFGVAEDLGTWISDTNTWQTCICGKVSNNWVFTGSLQATWNHGAYNGYDECWNANCDGA